MSTLTYSLTDAIFKHSMNTLFMWLF